MQTITASRAKTHFGEFLDRAQRGPVCVTRHDRVVGIMVSAEDYEAIRRFHGERLVALMLESADAASKAGMTPELLEELLADES